MYTATLSYFLVQPSSGSNQPSWKRTCAPGNGLFNAAESMVDSRDEGENSDARWSDRDLRGKTEWMEI